MPNGVQKKSAPKGTTTRTKLTDADRLRIIEFTEKNPGLRQELVAEHIQKTFRISVSQATISKTIKVKDQIKKQVQENPANFKAVRQRNVKYPDVDDALFKWFELNQAACV
jgi:hypothetical protein